MTHTQAAVQIQDLRKSFGHVIALDWVDLQTVAQLPIPAGCAVGSISLPD